MATVDRQQVFSGTKDVAAALRIEVASLERYLAANVAGFAGPLTVRQFKGGQSNPTYLLETPQRRYVLRRKPPGKLLPSAHAVDREYRVIRALHAQGFPVAQPLVYCADESVAGTPFYVMDFVDGRVFWEPQMPGIDPAERAAVYDSMNATIAQLHGFDPAKIGLGDFGKGENYVARQVDRWSKQYRASQTEKIEAMVLVSGGHYFPEQARAIMARLNTDGLTEKGWQALRKRHKHGDEQIRALYRQANGFADSHDDMNLTPQSLGSITARTLIVHGDRDPFFPLEIPLEQYRSIPGSALWIVPNNGHVPIFGEMAPNFARTAIMFLNSKSHQG